MKTILLAVLLSFLAPVSEAQSQPLKRHRPQLANIEQEVGFTLYEKIIPLATAKAFRDYLGEKNPGYELRTVVISKMPASTDLYFLAVQRGNENDEGNLFLVLQKQGAEIKEIARASNDILCGMLDPAFFTGSGRVLIILSISAFDGGYCGSFPFEFKGDKLTAMGDIPVYDGVHGRGGFQGHSPIETATAAFRQNTYYVTMRGRGSLYGDKDQRLARPRIPLTYYFDGKTFQPARAVSKRRANTVRVNP